MIKNQIIMEKSLELFSEQGIESTSIQQITERCNISKGAFYLSFKSKDELISALMDQFMSQFISDIDYTVKNGKNTDTLLYDFYYVNLVFFDKYSGSAKVFMLEHAHFINEEFISRMHYYNQLFEKTILYMVELLYGNDVQETKYDLVHCIKGFIKSYSELLLVSKASADIETLAHSLVEKTNILANHMTIPYISGKRLPLYSHPFGEQPSSEEMTQVIDQTLDEIKEDSIERESLTLLKKELLNPSLGPALTKGLIENLHHHPQCKWLSYLLRDYFKF